MSPVVFRAANFELASDGQSYTAAVHYTSRRFKAGRELGYLTVPKGTFEFAGIHIDVESMQLICDKSRKYLVSGKQEITNWDRLSDMIYSGKLILHAPMEWSFRWLDFTINTVCHRVTAECYIWPFRVFETTMTVYYLHDHDGNVIEPDLPSFSFWWLDHKNEQAVGDWSEYVVQMKPGVFPPEFPSICQHVKPAKCMEAISV